LGNSKEEVRNEENGAPKLPGGRFARRVWGLVGKKTEGAREEI